MTMESEQHITGWIVVVRTGIDNTIRVEHKGPMAAGAAHEYRLRRMLEPHTIATVHPLTQAV